MAQQGKTDKYINWVKGGLAYGYLKDGMKGFAADVVEQEHKRILQNVINIPGPGCNQCSLANLKPSHTCTEDPVTGSKTCPWGQNDCNCLSTKAQPCPFGICDAIMEEILKTHGSKPSRPNWGNTDARKWCSNPWEMAKCFITSPGYFDKSQADEFDGAALLQLYINNVSYMGHLSEKLSRSDTLKKILQRRNEMFHSPTIEIELSEFKECLDEITVLLEDEKELKARREAQEAVCKLKELKLESSIITTQNEAAVIQDASIHILKNVQEMSKLLSEAHTSVRDKRYLKRALKASYPVCTNGRSIQTNPANHNKKLDIMRQNYQELIKCAEESQDSLWMAFIDDEIKTDLLAEGIMPRNKLLQIACTKLGRDSNIVRQICSKISEFIKLSTNDIIATWAAYQESEQNDVVFVVFTRQERAQIVVKDYIIHQRKINTYSFESLNVLPESSKALENDFPADKVIELKECIATHADSLMNSHSNLNIISPSLKRSRGYGTSSWAISDELCIVLYIDVKGFIPIQEKPFPKELDGFPIDVWEGGFESFCGGPKDAHQHMKMGLAIYANTNKYGTLGGFVEHQGYRLCGITCSHVLLSDEEMRYVIQNGGQLNMNKPVYQPNDPSTSTRFGRVVSAVINNDEGVEVAMFELENKFPIKGDFPKALNSLQGGFDDKHPLLFNSGAVLDVSNMLKGRLEVYKFGSTTEITRGSFALQGTVIRRRKGQFGSSFRYLLKNLIEIHAIGDEPFARHGDSGALVMIEGEGGDSVAIGMVKGGSCVGRRVYVMPICNILESLGCRPLTMFRFDKNED